MDLTKKGFHLPEKIKFEEDTLTNSFGRLIAEPLERGYGTTLGNSLRRVLLSSIEGAAATAVRIRGALHEYASLEGVKEDVVDIILNIKELNFAMDGSGEKTAIVKATGPKEITGADLQVDSSIKVMNPDKLIATIEKGTEFEAEIYIGKGKGYVTSDENADEEVSVDIIPVDSVFSPVRKVNFFIEKARVGRSTDYDRLVMEIETNGSVSPVSALSQAASILCEHLNYFVFETGEEGMESAAENSAIHMVDGPLNVNLLRSVDELELSVRAHNCLKNADIQTIADLVQKTEYEMLRTKNFGRKSLNEIKEILGTMGLGFGMRIDEEALKSMRGSTNEA